MDSRARKFQEERSWHDWYSALVLAIPPLTPDEYSATIASFSAPKDSAEYRTARELLITSHLREILSMAKDRPHYRLPVADYVGIGNLAVVRHFDEFVPERGAFSELVRCPRRDEGPRATFHKAQLDILEKNKCPLFGRRARHRP